MLQERARALGVSCQFSEYREELTPARTAGALSVLHLPLATRAVCGQLDRQCARHAAAHRRHRRLPQREFAAMVTAPVQKSVINEADSLHRAHRIHRRTLPGATGGHAAHRRPAARRAGDHAPAARRSRRHHAGGLLAVLQILSEDLRTRAPHAAPRPRGLNPHAGERHPGNEEQLVITWKLAAARASWPRRARAFPADTLFVPRISSPTTPYWRYHDQGLPVLASGFGATT
jgi:4-hydroxythreonine-4-phosphate dehydrogenase